MVEKKKELYQSSFGKRMELTLQAWQAAGAEALHHLHHT